MMGKKKPSNATTSSRELRAAIAAFTLEELMEVRQGAVDQFFRENEQLFEMQAVECQPAEKYFGPYTVEGWLLVKLNVDVGDGVYALQTVTSPTMLMGHLGGLIASINLKWVEVLRGMGMETDEDA